MHPSPDPTTTPATLDESRRRVLARAEQLRIRRERLGRRRQLLGYALSAAVAACLALALLVLVSHLSGWPLALAFGLLLALLVPWQILRRHLDREHRLADLYQSILARLDGNAPIASRGEAFTRPGHPFAHDLSLLGEHSLFAHLPPARTQAGAERLAAFLLDPPDLAAVLERQAAVQELAPDLLLREHIALLGPAPQHGISPSGLRTWASAPPITLPRFASPVLLLASAGVLVLLLLGALGRVPWSVVLLNLTVLLAVQAAVTLPLRQRVATALTAADRLAPEVLVLREALALLTSTQPRSPHLQRLHTVANAPSPVADTPSPVADTPSPVANAPSPVADTHSPTPRLLGQLESRLSLVDQRHQQWFIVASLLFSAGTQSAIALERWRARHGAALLTWLATWAEFDALNALAAFTFEHPHYAWPTLEAPDAPARFEVSGLRHPLLLPERAVPNTVALNPRTRFLLISGSNMSGKSTLLRSIGCTAVLAYAGAPVPCTSARLSVLRLCASIAPSDSLAEGRSRFLAEIQQIHGMLRPTAPSTEPTPDPPATLFLIDELLGGTNSVDRHAAASSVLHRLIAEGAIGALSTHDLALTPLADDPALHGLNCHMSSPDPADPLRFDFQLRPGSNHISSAPALLRLLGL